MTFLKIRQFVHLYKIERKVNPCITNVFIRFSQHERKVKLRNVVKVP